MRLLGCGLALERLVIGVPAAALHISVKLRTWVGGGGRHLLCLPLSGYYHIYNEISKLLPTVRVS